MTSADLSRVNAAKAKRIRKAASPCASFYSRANVTETAVALRDRRYEQRVRLNVFRAMRRRTRA